MPRHDRAHGVYHSSKSHGHSRKDAGIGSYAKRKKARTAEHYERPYLTGNYRKD